MRATRFSAITLVGLFLVLRCASLEPEDGDVTSLATGDVAPSQPSQVVAQNGCTTEPNKLAANPTPTSPSSTPVPSELGFVGSPARGFSLQNTEFPNLCLAARGNTLVNLNAYVLLPCSSHPSQLFYWALGTLAQTSSLCMVGQHSDHGVYNSANCPASPPAGQYSLSTSGAVWVLAQDSNTLYTNGNNLEAGTWTVGPVASSLAANQPLQMKVLGTSEAVAHFAPTTRLAGATHIYLQDGNGTRCLTEASGLVVLNACASTSSQLWDMKNFNFVSNSGLCLTASSATQGSSVNLQTCAAGNQRQGWWLAAGAIGLATPVGSVQYGALALDMNAAVSTTQPSVGLMSLSAAKWSIGAQNYH